LDFDSRKVGSTNHAIEISGDHTPAMPRMSLRSYETTKFATGIFKTVCHFGIRTTNERPVISDLAIHKFLAFCTTYLCEAAFQN